MAVRKYLHFCLIISTGDKIYLQETVNKYMYVESMSFPTKHGELQSKVKFKVN